MRDNELFLTLGIMVLAMCAIYDVYIQPPQLIVYETVDENSLRVCQNNNDINLNTAIECSEQLKQCGKEKADDIEQLRVCRKYQPSDNTLTVLLISFICTGIGYVGRGILEEYKKSKELKEKEVAK